MAPLAPEEGDVSACSTARRLSPEDDDVATVLVGFLEGPRAWPLRGRQKLRDGVEPGRGLRRSWVPGRRQDRPHVLRLPFPSGSSRTGRNTPRTVQNPRIVPNG